jgi:hypothetical protein
MEILEERLSIAPITPKEETLSKDYECPRDESDNQHL